MMNKEINFVLNGENVSLQVSPDEILLEVLREKLGVKSPKCGCNKGDCGTCTVILNGKTVRSCLVLAIEVDKQEVLTIEGLMESGLTLLQESFLKNNSFQCGFCAPGIILSATELLGKNSKPEKREIQEAIAGNLCRCSGYSPIIDAIIDLTN
jgi:aerobic carbon-monoxide dehydrogenase small subunit